MSGSGPATSGKPYPVEWERHEYMRDGTPVFVRPLKPEDAALYPDFIAGLTHDDLRLRFFAPLREVSPDLIDRLTHLDYARAMAFIALDEASGKMLGVVRLHDDPDTKGSGEFAVIVLSSLKGHGLGWLLMQRMIEYARAEGLRSIHGEILNENLTMLQMCRELGFEIIDDPTEHGVQLATLHLDAAKGPHAS